MIGGDRNCRGIGRWERLRCNDCSADRGLGVAFLDDGFLAFTRYSQGPLPEDLLAQLPCPALVLWGTEDPWEPIELGRAFAEFEAVEDFIPLEGAGHCPQDEIPEQVNPLLRDWIFKHSPNPASTHTAE